MKNETVYVYNLPKRGILSFVLYFREIKTAKSQEIIKTL